MSNRQLVQEVEFIFNPEFDFQERMQKVFLRQIREETVYNTFCGQLGYDANRNGRIQKKSVPLLPVEAFRDTVVGFENAPVKFKSSGTRGMKPSVHFVREPELYKRSIEIGMKQFYDLDDYAILGYLPGYQDNPNSSLVWMINYLISRDESGLSEILPVGKAVSQMKIDAVKAEGKSVMLFGAAFGLLDLAGDFPVKLPADCIIIETGGMKTHRREMSRDDMHQQLAEAFGLQTGQIHSEYGMAELLSQAWADGSGWFKTPHWMQISIRNPENPLEELPDGRPGLIGVIDLANYYSCSFLLTGDEGVKEKNAFQVLGRYHPENLRGCNFLVDQD